MAKIKQLSAYEAQKIAAGEVVDRPANIVKELLENSLDAGATSITIYLEDGGRKLIRIIDNGCGMDAQDARMCIKHHATSKITQVSDLEHIATFGFRGEALSSISSVSKVTLTTKEDAAQAGITLHIEGGEIKHESISAAVTGTDIAIQDIFYNVPARKKFLKTRDTEYRAIIQLFFAFCVNYPHIQFKLYSENKLTYNCPAVQHLSLRLAQLYDNTLASQLLLLDATGDHDRMRVKITGAITEPQYTRYDRNQLLLFVNQRWVKNHKLAQALLKGYQGMLPTDKYPAGFIFITVDPTTIDVNIHPRKEEVQFLHPRVVETLLETTVRKRLEAYHSIRMGATTDTSNSIPAISAHLPSRAPYTHTPVAQAMPVLQAYHALPEVAKPSQQDEHHFLEIINKSFGIPTPPAQHSVAPQAHAVIESENILHKQSVINAGLEYKLIGQVLQTYIIIETAEGLAIIDQHAAHERIVYENIANNFNAIARIKLLFAQIITLTALDLAALMPYLSVFNDFGLQLEPIGPHELAISETPVWLKNQSIDDIVKQAISLIHDHASLEPIELKKIMQEKMHAQIACKAAIKAGDIVTLATMHELIKNLHCCPNKLTCPHGRPTMWVLGTSDIEKKFKRDYR